MSDIETTNAVESTPGSRSRSRSRSQRPNYKIDDAGFNKSDEDEEYKEEDEVEEEEEEEEEVATKVRNGRRTKDNKENYLEEEGGEEKEDNIPHRRSKRTRSKIREEEQSETLKEKEQGNDSNTVKKDSNEGTEGTDNKDEKENDSGIETPKGKKKSGEPTNNQNNEDSHLNKKMKLSYPVDSDGHPLPVINDEYALPDDPSGEEKIDTDGNLKGGRKFKVRTFKLFDNGDRLFMLATEPARAVGLRDSATLFQLHPNLYKYILSQSEKNKLIGQSVLPYSYRNRTISVVAARSIFKEFGHQIIVNGKENDDDYYSDPTLRHNIVKEGQIPRDKQSHRSKKGRHAKYKHGKSSSQSNNNDNNSNNSNNNVATDTTNKYRHTEGQEYMDQAELQSSTDPAKNTVEFFQNNQSHGTNTSNANAATSIASTNGINTNNTMGMNINNNYNALFNTSGSQLNATNWLYQHAAACSRYNSDIYYDRVRILLIENQGIRDPYTNTLHVPQGTQPTKIIRYQKVDSSKKADDTSDNKGVQYEVLIEDKDLLRPATGLSRVPREIYEDIVEKTTLEAIEQQRLFEEGL